MPQYNTCLPGIRYRKNPRWYEVLADLLTARNVTPCAHEWIFVDHEPVRNPRYRPEIVMECLLLMEQGDVEEFLPIDA